MLDRIEDTIVAISSAPGTAAVGIVRLSGPAAIEIVSRVAHVDLPRPLAAAAALRPTTVGLRLGKEGGDLEGSGFADGTTLADQPSWMRIDGEVEIAPGARCPAFFHIFRGPRSYTRQDVVEIYTVGSPVVLEMVRKACVEGGARDAEPGEFTARAFLNGAMSLDEAEGVAGVIRAQSDVQLRASRRMMDGELARRIGRLRDELAELLALVEADIDFAEEPIEFITTVELQERLGRVAAVIGAVHSDVPTMERLDRLPQILLLGPPNAGKSSLMNRLSGTNRAICAAVAGTTRDILSAPVRLGRAEAILLDTAGVDETEDQVIASARELTLSAAERVDLVCLVIDAAEALRDEAGLRRFVERVRQVELPAMLVAANKCDLIGAEDRPAVCAGVGRLGLGSVHMMSAVTGEGVEALRALLGERLGETEATVGGEAVLMTDRQRAAVGEARQALQRAIDLAAGAAETIDCADVLAFELREALDALGAVSGAVTTEDLLSQVFARFCIGK